jgi:hypothetical protein
VKEFYSVADLAQMAGLSADQVRRMLDRHGFERPGGPRTRWLVSHTELMTKWPELVLSVREVAATRRRDAA